MWFCFFIPIWLVLALIPAMIAKNKGYEPALFYLYGLFFFLIALVHSMLLASKQEALALQPGMKQCPSCLSAIPAAATKCKHCTADQPLTG